MHLLRGTRSARPGWVWGILSPHPQAILRKAGALTFIQAYIKACGSRIKIEFCAEFRQPSGNSLPFYGLRHVPGGGLVTPPALETRSAVLWQPSLPGADRNVRRGLAGQGGGERRLPVEGHCLWQQSAQ